MNMSSSPAFQDLFHLDATMRNLCGPKHEREVGSFPEPRVVATGGYLPSMVYEADAYFGPFSFYRQP